MKVETILKDIKSYLESGNIAIIMELKNKLEEDIRKNTAYKTSSKSRVNAISKMMKYNNKMGRVHLSKAFTTDGSKFIFTNSYYMVELNDSLGYEVENKDFTSFMNKSYNYDNLGVDLNDILASYKMKVEWYNINGINYDIEYLKQVMDIMGSGIKFYQCLDNEYMLYIENENNERGIILGARKF